MRVQITLDLSDDDLTEAYGDLNSPLTNWGDVEATLAARLSEAGYFGRDGMPVRGDLVEVTRA